VARCYHRTCGRTFGGVVAFDRHLRLRRTSPWAECVDPVEAGLEARGDVWVQGRQGAIEVG
jgi:hypothetical protein